MKGTVIKNTGSWYSVLTDEGTTVLCKIKGNFRLKDIRSTNPVAVGDRVVIEERGERREERGKATGRRAKLGNERREERDLLYSGTRDDATAFITDIDDRRNYIVRRSQNLSKASHIIAANVDQALLIVTINYPETSTTFIDRFLASAEAYDIPVVLVFNKTDLLTDEEKHYQDMMINLYETVGYKCVAISAETGDGVDALRDILKDKTTVLSGNSGVGKSTLLNKLIPDIDLRTAEISDAHNTGMHTTTFSEMLRLPFGGWAIDTPGVKGFGSFDMEPEELTSYFKEIFHFSKNCRFSNCTHTHEPGCAVLQALEDHYIAPSRYQSYLSMLEDKEGGKYRT